MDGVQVAIERLNNGGNNNIRDVVVQLVTNGVRDGVNRADTALNWPGTQTVKNYGYDTNLWELSLTPAIVNAAGFGVAVVVRSLDNNERPCIDYILITNTYTSPDMAVLGTNLATVADGDTTPATADGTDFGSIGVAAGAISQTFTVTNMAIAETTLSMTGTPTVAISGGGGAFTVSAQPASTDLTGGQTTTFTVQFDPSVGGTFTATVSIGNTDPDENPYNFDIQGAGLDCEMDVQWTNGTSIADGDASPSSTDGTDFGSVLLAGATLERTFVVTNAGAGVTLSLNGTPTVSISGAHAADFTVTAQPSPTNITAGGAAVTFTVQFDPSAVGARNATLSITNNDASEALYDFAITGTGINPLPEIAVWGTNSAVIADSDFSPATADGSDFGSLSIQNATLCNWFWITNSGSGTLTLNGSPLVTITGAAASDFTVVQQPRDTSLTPGECTAFLVEFNPSVAAARTGYIVIANDDSDENPYDFAVTGTGLAGSLKLYDHESVSGQAWNDTPNWAPNGVPDDTKDVAVGMAGAGVTICDLTDARTANSLLIYNGKGLHIISSGTLTVDYSMAIETNSDCQVLSSGSRDVTLGGSLRNDGLLSCGSESGAFIFGGSGYIDADGATGSGSGPFWDLTVSGRYWLLSDVTVEGDLNVPGTLYLNGRTLLVKGNATIGGTLHVCDGTLTVKGALSASGALRNGSGTINAEGSVAMAGYVCQQGTFVYAGSGQSVTTGAYHNLTVSGSGATLGANITNNNALTVLNGGLLNLANKTVVFTNGASLMVNAGGTLSAAGATVQSAAAGQYFSITVDGIVNIDGLTVNRPGNNGFTFGLGSVVTRFDSVTFQNGQNGVNSRYVCCGQTAGTLLMAALSFDANCQYNVTAPSGASVNLANSSGAKGGTVNGPAYEGAVAANITWTDANIWQGDDATNPSKWSEAENWSRGAVPTTSDLVQIPDVTTDPVVDVNAVCGSLVIQTNGALTMSTADVVLDVTGGVQIDAGGTLSMPSASAVLKVGGSWSRSGTFAKGSGTVVFDNSAVDQSIPAETFNNLTIDKGSKTVSLTGNLKIGGALNVVAGNLLCGSTSNTVGLTTTVLEGGRLVLGNLSALVCTGALTVANGGELALYDDCDLHIGVSLTVDNGATPGKLTAESAGTLASIRKSGAGTWAVTIGGEVYVEGLELRGLDDNGLTLSDGATITKLNDVHYVNGDNNGNRYLRILDSSTATYMLRDHDFDANCTGTGAKNVYVPTVGASVVMVAATGAGAGAAYEDDPGTHISWDNEDTWKGGAGPQPELLVRWDRTGNWVDGTIPTATDPVCIVATNGYNCSLNNANAVCQSLVIKAGAQLTIEGAYSLGVGTDLEIENSGIFNMPYGSVSVGGNWTVNGTYSANASTTVSFTNITAVDRSVGLAATMTFPNLTVSGTMSIADSDTVEVMGTFNPSGGTINVGAGTTLKTLGNWAAMPAIFNRGTSTVDLGGTNNVPPLTYYNLTIRGTATLTNNITVKNDLTVLSGATLNLNGYTLTVERNVNNAGTLSLGTGRLKIDDVFTTTGTLNENTGTIEYTGDGQTIPGETYYDLDVNALSYVIVSAGIQVNHALKVYSGKLRLGSQTITFGDGALIDVDSQFESFGGTLTSTGAGAFFGIDVSGSLNVNGLTVAYPTNTGFMIRQAGTILSFDDVVFTNGQNGVDSRYLWMEHSSGAVGLYGLSFDASANTNVMAPNGIIVSLVNTAGERGGEVNGELYDGPDDERILWTSANVWEGDDATAPRRWSVTNNWSKGTVPSISEVAVIVDTANDPVLDANGVCAALYIYTNASLTLTSNDTALTVGGSVSIKAGGTLTMSNVTTELRFTGSWGNSGTFNGRLGTVTFASTVADQALPTGEHYPSVRVEKGAKKAFVEGVVFIDGSLTVASGLLYVDTATTTLNISSNCDVSGTIDLAPQGQIKVSGAIDVKPGGQIIMNGDSIIMCGRSLTVRSGAPNGKLVASGSPQITWDEVSRYSFTVMGELNVNGLTIGYGDANGLTVSNGATIGGLDNIAFQNGLGASTTYLRILELDDIDYQFSQCTFDNNCQYNVYVPAASSASVLMLGAGGAKSGEAFDDDSGEHVDWISQKLWDGSSSTAWDAQANWADNVVPVASNDVLIAASAARACEVNTATSTVSSIQVEAGATLRIGAATGNSLTVSNNITVAAGGTVELQNDTTITLGGDWLTGDSDTLVLKNGTASGTVVMNGAAAKINPVVGGAGAETFDNLTIAGTVTIDDDDVITVTGAFNPVGGTLKMGDHAKLATVGNWAGIPAGFVRNNSTIELGGTADAPVLTYYDLNIAGAVTLTNNITVMNNLWIKSGATLNLGGYTLTVVGGANNQGTLDLDTGRLKVGGTFTASGTLTEDLGTIEFNGTGAQTIPAETYYNLDVNGSTATPDAGVTVSHGVNVLAGALSLGNKTVTLGNGAVVHVDGTLRSSGGTLKAGSGYFGLTVDGTLNLSGLTLDRLTNTGCRIEATATVVAFDYVTYTNGQGGGCYLWVGHNSGAFTFMVNNFDTAMPTNVMAPNGCTVDLISSLGTGAGEAYDGTVDANITWNFANLWVAHDTENPYLWNVASNWTKRTVPVDGEVAWIQNTAGTNPILNADAVCGGVLIASGARLWVTNSGVTLDINGSMNVQAGGILTLNNSSARIRVSGGWTRAGTFQATAGTVSFDSTTTDQSVPYETFPSLDCEKGARALNLAENVTVNGNLRVLSGTVNTGAKTHTVAGTTDIYGTLNLVNGGTLTSTGPLNVRTGGVVRLTDTCTLKLGNAINVHAGAVNGSLFVEGTTPTITWDGLTRYACCVAGAIKIDALNLNYCDANGLTCSNGAVITDIDYVDFNLGLPAATTYLRILDTGAGSYSFTGCDFDENCLTNVQAVAGSSQITMVGSSGARTGASYENDPDNAHIVWNLQTVWDGSASTAWNTGNNWSDNAVPGDTNSVYIPSAPRICNVDISTAMAKSIEVDAGGELVLDAAGDMLTVSNDFAIGADGTLTMSAGSLRVAGNWTANSAVNMGGGSVVCQGNSILGGSGVSSFNALIVSNTLALGASDKIGNASPLTVAAGAKFDAEGYNDTVGRITGDGEVELNGGTLTLADSANYTFSGALSGSGTLQKNGSGALTLNMLTSGLNDFAGTLTVGAGRLEGTNYAVAAGGTVRVNASAQITAGTTNDILTTPVGGALVLNGAYKCNVAGYGSVVSNDLLALTGALSGTGGVDVVLLNGFDPALDTNWMVISSSSADISGLTNHVTVNGSPNSQYTLSKVANDVYLSFANPTEYTWNTNAGGMSWTNNACWDPNVSYPRIPGHRAVMGSVITANRAVDVPIAVTLGRLIFDNANNYTLQNAAGSLVLDNNGNEAEIAAIGGGDPTISVGQIVMNDNLVVSNATGSDITIGCALTNGAVSVTKKGGGVLTLSAAGSLYSGGTSVQEGRLQLSGGADRLPSATDLTIASGAIFDLNDQSQTIASLTGAGNVEFGDTAGNTLTVNQAVNTTASGAISERGDLTKSGAGALTLANGNTYTGLTTVAAGALNFTGDSSAMGGRVVVDSGARLGGTGIIGCAVTNFGGSFISGGTTSTVGTLTLNDALSLDGTYSCTLTNDGIGDRIIVGGTITGTGGIDVAFGSGYFPAVSNSWLILSGGASSDFSGITNDLTVNGAVNSAFSLDIVAATNVYLRYGRAPGIDNNVGASNIYDDVATLTGNLTSTGGLATYVFMYWGAANGGADKSAWANTNALGVRGEGIVTNPLSGLTTNQTYWYRCLASNGWGESWAAASTNWQSKTDIDGDGVPNWWEVLYGLTQTVSNAGVDTDGDGTTDRDEWLANTDPTNANRNLQILAAAPTNLNDVAITMYYGPQRQVRILGSSNPTNGFTPLYTFTTGASAATNTWLDAGVVVQTAQRFYEISVTQTGACSGTATNTTLYGMFRQPRQPSSRYLVCVPVNYGSAVENNLSNRLGQALASGLYAGTTTNNADMIMYLDPASGEWAEFYLFTNAVAGTVYWYDQDIPGEADLELAPGYPLWVLRRSQDVNRSYGVFAGRAHTTAATFNINTNGQTAGAWQVVGWPLARSVRQPNLGPGATPTNVFGFAAAGAIGGTSISTKKRSKWGDQIWVWENGRWTRTLYLVDNGLTDATSMQYNDRWWDADTGTFADFTLSPGMAFYYYHTTNQMGGNFTWTPTAP